MTKLRYNSLMRRKTSIILFFIGFVAIFSLAVERYRRDRDRAEQHLQDRSTAVALGWQTRWNEFLLTTARAGKLKESYYLEFDRAGKLLKTDFFPKHLVSLDWAAYRKMVADSKTEQSRSFLLSAFQIENSWDRILAIRAWPAAFGNFPVANLDPYERSVAEEEARKAYELIFLQFSQGKDFTLASAEFAYDLVFYRVKDNGNILAFVPAVNELKGTLFREFLTKENIVDGTLGATPWQVQFGTTVLDHDSAYTVSEWILIGLIILGFSLGIATFAATAGEERRKLLRQVGFLNQVIHEVKTPLTGLKLHADVISRHGPRPESLTAIRESVRRIDGVFNDLAAVIQSRGRQDCEKISADELTAIIEGIVQEFAGAVVWSGVVTRQSLGNKTAIEVILRNLFGNAVNYGRSATVTVSEAQQTLILVKDAGPGVAKKDAKRIFQEFYRAESARQQRPSGLGLGLSVARRLSVDMGATITLRNPGNPGAEFVLTLARI